MDGLQFDKADFGSGAAAVCSFCKAPLSQYFDVNGKAACEGCVTNIRGQLDGGAGGWGMALLFGLGMALVTGVAYGVSRQLTGINLGIVSVGVGWLVGRAVRKGQGAGGGTGQQVLAAALTYLAIVVSFIPELIASNGAALVASNPLLVLGLCLRATVDTEHPLSILIYAFALYQAFAVTRGSRISITGPFQVAAAPLNPPPQPPEPASIG